MTDDQEVGDVVVLTADQLEYFFRCREVEFLLDLQRLGGILQRLCDELRGPTRTYR